MTLSFYEDPRARHVFAYATVDRVREEGISAPVMAAEKVLERLRAVGEIINRVTTQFFLPVEGTERVSVDPRDACIHLDNQDKILAVRSVKVADSAGALTSIAANRYRIDDRYIHMTQPRFGTGIEDKIAAIEFGDDGSRFPPGTRHILVDGAFGWQEERPHSDDGTQRFISTTTTASLTDGAELVPVADSSKFRVGDALIIRQGDNPLTPGCHAIVTKIVDATSLTVDPLRIVARGVTIASGSTVISYGRVPREVELAAIILVNRFRYGVATAQAASAAVQSRIRAEMTDNYQYTLEPRGAAAQFSNSTGDLEADRLLSQFHAPPYVGGV